MSDRLSFSLRRHERIVELLDCDRSAYVGPTFPVVGWIGDATDVTSFDLDMERVERYRAKKPAPEWPGDEQTVTIDWGDPSDLAAGQVPARPRSLSVNGVRYEPVFEIEDVRRDYEEIKQREQVACELADELQAKLNELVEDLVEARVSVSDEVEVLELRMIERVARWAYEEWASDVGMKFAWKDYPFQDAWLDGARSAIRGES